MSDDFTPGPAPPAFSLAATLIRYAVRSAPPALAERLEEEWLADLAAQPSSWAGLSLALGCCWATRVIAREHRAASAALAAGGSKNVSVGLLRSRSMALFKWLWIAVAALAVTAVGMLSLMFAVGHLFPWFARYSAYIVGSGAWLPQAVTGGITLWMMVVGWRQMRVVRTRDGALRQPFWWLQPLLISVTSVGLFATSAAFGFMALRLPGPARPVLWGMVVMFAVMGAYFLAMLAHYYRLRRRRDDASGLPIGRWRG